MEQEGLFVDLRADSAPMERGFKRASDAADQMTRVIEARTRRIDDVCNRLNTTAVSALRSVASQIAGIGGLMAGGALTVDRIIRQADAWKQTSNQLALVTQGTAELRGAQDALFATAQKSRQAYGSVVDLYTRGAKAASELGASQDQLRRFAEGAALATSLGGKSAQEQAGAIQQLGQLLNSTRVQAEEYNSVLDGSPRIAQAVADGLETAGGSVGRLKRLIDDGKVSNREFFAAFLSQVPKIEAEFSKLTPTMAEAGTVFDNALGRLIGRSDESAGATTMMARAIIDFSNDLDHAASVAVMAGGALATVLVARGLGPMLPALVQGTAAFANLAGQIIGAEAAILRGADAATAYANVMPGAARSSQMMAVETLSMARAEQTAAAARVQGLETARAEAAQLAAAATAQRAEAAARYEMAQGIVTATGRRQVAAKALSEQNVATAAMIAHTRQLRAVEAELAVATAAKTAADERAALATVAHDAAMQKASLSARVSAAAMATLNGALSLVGGPVGAAILGVAGAIAFVATRSTEAERATEAFTAAQEAARNAMQDSSVDVDALARGYDRLSDSMKAVTGLKLEEALQKQRDAIAAQRRAAQQDVFVSRASPFAIVEGNHGADNLTEVRAFERMGLAAQQVDRLRAAFEAFRTAAKDDPQAIASLVQALDSIGREAGAAGGPLLDLARKLADPATKAGEAAQAAKELEARLALLKNPADAAARAVLDAGRDAATASSGFNQMAGAVDAAVAKVTDLSAKAKLLSLPAGFARRVAEIVGPEPEVKTPVVTGLQDRRTNSSDTAYQQHQTATAVVGIGLARTSAAELKERTAEVQRQTAANRLLAGALTDTAKAEAQNRVELSKAALEYPGLGAATAATILTTKDFGATLATLPPELQALWKQMGASSAAQLSGEFAQLAAQTSLETASTIRLAEAYGQGAAAVEAANRQIEIETRLLKLGEGARGQVTAMVNAEADARQRLDMAKWVAETDAQMAAARRLADAEAKGGEAVAEANVQNKIAEELARQRIGTGTKEAGVIAAKIRALEGENRARRAAAEQRSADDDLSYARTELALMGQTEQARERALVSLRNQQQAARLAGEIGVEAAQRWLTTQEQIADTRALTAYADAVRQTADTIATDWAEALFDAMTMQDKSTSILDAIKALLRRIALEFLKTRIVMPVVTQVVGSAPSLFGIQAPAGAGQGGDMSSSLMNWGMNKAMGYGAEKMGLSPGSMLDNFGSSYLGIAPTAAQSIVPAVGGQAATTAATTINPATGSLAAYNSWGAAGAQGAASSAGGIAGSGVGLGTAAGGVIGAAGAGYAVGGYVGTKAQSKPVGALGGAAAGAAYGTMILPGWGTAIGAVIGAIAGAVGTTLISNREGNATLDFDSNEITLGGQTGKKYSEENRKAAQSMMFGVQSLAQALEDILPGEQLTAKSAFLAVGDRDATRAQYGDKTAEFGKKGDVTGVFDWFAAQLTADMRAGMEAQGVTNQIAENVLTVLERGVGKSVEQFVSDLTFAATDFGTAYDAVGKAGADDFSRQIEGLSVEFQLAQHRASDLGLATAGFSDTFQKATDRLFDAANRSLSGLGGVDAALTAMESWRTSTVALMGAGLSTQPAMDLLGQQLRDITVSFGDGIDGLQRLIEAGRILRDMGQTTAATWMETRAEQVRAVLAQGLDMRQMAAQVALGTLSQDAYDMRALEIQQLAELAVVTDAAYRADLERTQLMERQALVARQAAQETAKQQALISAGGDTRKWLDQRAGVASTSVSPEEALQAAQSQFARDLALARGGDADASRRITDTADRLLAATDAVHASGAEYQAMERWVLSSIASLPATVGYDQQILAALQALGGSVNVQVELETIRVITESLNALSNEDRNRLTQTAVVLRTVEERIGRRLSDSELAALVTAGAVERSIEQEMGRDLTAAERAALVPGGDILRVVEQALGRTLTDAELDGIVAGGSVIRKVEQQLGRALTAAEQAAIILPGSVQRVIGQQIDPATGSPLVPGGTVTRTVTQTVETTETYRLFASLENTTTAILSSINQGIQNNLTQLHALGLLLYAGNADRQKVLWNTAMTAERLGGVGLRARGGPVKAGRTYIVGEQGPEKVTFDADGMVYPSGVEPPIGNPAFDPRVPVPRRLIDAPAAVAARLDVQPVVGAIDALTVAVERLRDDVVDLGRADHEQRAALSGSVERRLVAMADVLDTVSRRVGGR
ncbi:tape measure protein [Azospirillum brasilense]|uniref:tape measure protein n=1 Tax=Azospirillum argentinense TaxID=2970906 RepID=UPI00190CDC5E|nr:tape measure protein [Azospirillum argentinense]MBK3799446.1 tape measure protein [Azospirillum argentinense]